VSKIKILVVDDELIITEELSHMLKEMGYSDIDIVMSFEDAINYLKIQRPDIALLDIYLDAEKSGIELGRILKEEYKIPFIYITSHSDKATVEKAKITQPNGYLIKPFKKEDLYSAIEVSLYNYVSEKSGTKSELKTEQKLVFKDSIFIKDGYLFVKIFFKDIKFLKSEGNYTKIQTDAKSLMIRSSLNDFLSSLPNDIFFRIHKSYIVNCKLISAISHNAVFIEKIEIPLGRTYREPLIKYLQLDDY